MDSMKNYIVATLAVIGLTLFLLYSYVGVPRIFDDGFTVTARPTLYNNPNQFIDEISVTAVYFVPANKVDFQINNWQELLSQYLDVLQQFHTVQFSGQSNLTYRIHPKPIIGKESNRAYDTDVTQHGNPEALRRIAQELEERNIGQSSSSAYHVIIILYEGVGAGGSDNVVLLSRFFLTGQEFRSYGATFLAHEFYHTLGVPDNYVVSQKVYPDGSSVPVEIVTSGDIMGRIRVPIEYTYLEQNTLQAMGL
jgi:hypothetical protein